MEKMCINTVTDLGSIPLIHHPTPVRQRNSIPEKKNYRLIFWKKGIFGHNTNI